MNQILSMQSNMNDGNKNNKINNKEPKYREYNDKASINSILRVFAIFIMLFGVALIGNSVYGMINSAPEQRDNISVSAENIGSKATIQITGERPIKQLVYKWGQGQETVVPGNGTIQLSLTLEIPKGNNILNMTVTDYYGNTQDFQKQYINEKNGPTIEIPSTTGNMLNIVVKDDKEVAYITYRWNNEAETRIDMDPTQADKTTLQTSIPAIKGENTLTIVAVDNDGNRETVTETIKGANGPTFTVTTEGNNIVINAKDEEGIGKISITVDGVTTDTGDTPINEKEITAQQEITPGTHTITITVTNLSGLSEEQSFTATL